MELLRQYVISVTTAAILCGILMALLRKGASQALVKLLCGFFLAFTLLHPMKNLELGELPELLRVEPDLSQDLTRQGSDYAGNTMAEIIKEKTRAYILEKAEELHLELEVSVTVGEGEVPVPECVYISGKASDFARTRMEAFLEKTLGIAKENQIWTG